MLDEAHRARIDAIIAENMGVDPSKVVPEASLIDDLLGDSLDIIELSMAIEDEFSIHITDDDNDGIERVGHYHELVAKRLAEKVAA